MTPSTPPSSPAVSVEVLRSSIHRLNNALGRLVVELELLKVAADHPSARAGTALEMALVLSDEIRGLRRRLDP